MVWKRFPAEGKDSKAARWICCMVHSLADSRDTLRTANTLAGEREGLRPADRLTGMKTVSTADDLEIPVLAP
jgi:hypothetical protein